MKQMNLPNLESLVSGFEQKPSNMTELKNPVATEVEPSVEIEPKQIDLSPNDTGLWEKFNSSLNEPREKNKQESKLCMINADIIETINQCGFKTSTTHVVNTILKVFLLENLDKLSELRKQRPSSLFDKYLTQ